MRHLPDLCSRVGIRFSSHSGPPQPFYALPGGSSASWDLEHATKHPRYAESTPGLRNRMVAAPLNVRQSMVVMARYRHKTRENNRRLIRVRTMLIAHQGRTRENMAREARVRSSDEVALTLHGEDYCTMVGFYAGLASENRCILELIDNSSLFYPRCTVLNARTIY